MSEVLSIDEIRKRLPHRYPFLMIDKVVEREAGKRVVALKNVTVNEPFFQGHYPENPVMPGVMIVEAMAQAGGLTLGEDAQLGVLPLLVAIQKVRFRRVVKPGDQLIITATVAASRGNFVKIAARGEVQGELAAEGELSFMLINEGEA